MSHKYLDCSKIHPNQDCYRCRFQDRHIEEMPCYSCIFVKECEFESTDIV